MITNSDLKLGSEKVLLMRYVPNVVFNSDIRTRNDENLENECIIDGGINGKWMEKGFGGMIDKVCVLRPVWVLIVMLILLIILINYLVIKNIMIKSQKRFKEKGLQIAQFPMDVIVAL